MQGTPAAGASVLEPRHSKLGIALGGGAALGLAHIGVLRVLERAGLAPGVVSGTSMGAVVGAAYAAGKLDLLEALAREVNWRRVLRLTDFQLGGSGVLEGRAIERELRRHFGEQRIEDLPIPFAAVATDLGTGAAWTATAGDLVTAVRASISLPAVFAPVRVGGHLLVDGGLVANVPVAATRALGADIVVGVDVTADFEGVAATVGLRDHLLPEGQRHGIRARLWAAVPRRLRGWPLLRRLRAWADEPSLIAVALASSALALRQLSLQQNAADPAALTVTPRVGHIFHGEFDRAEELIRIGEAAMEESLDALSNLTHSIRAAPS
ncbi:patatin-like phospholipase family protein [Thiohalocapsa sp.]|jgi:NTE family protein|uniref:patatin-like phospholipase family protein n=1 Tax=Thiohalocapsa sp. TaxID=2497641 RepID=UPI0025FE3DEE|nr:patatin-like phospholipase family protein [Thiohalocapsa sp.]